MDNNIQDAALYQNLLGFKDGEMNQTTKQLKKLMNTEFTGTNASTRQYYRFMKLPPTYTKLRRRVFYRSEDLEIWIESGFVKLDNADNQTGEM